MIVLDTNVISEAIRPAPSPAVDRWGNSQQERLVTTAVTVGELLYGAQILPPGRRRDALQLFIEQRLLGLDLILPYDDRAARVCAAVRAQRRHQGRPISVEDAMIAAICLSNGADLATRNIADFEALGLHLINPWDAG